MLKAYPDVAQVVHIVRLSDPIPREPLVFRRGLSPEVKDRLVVALISLARSEDGLALFSELCGIEGLVPSTDRDYDLLRWMASTVGIDDSRLLLMR